MGNAAYVPELKESATACRVHCFGDLGPTFNLCIGEDAGSVGIAEAAACNGSGFCDDKAGGGALLIILRVEFVGDIAGAGAATGERGHENAVGQLEASELDGREYRRRVFHVFIFAKRCLSSGFLVKYQNECS